MRNLARILTVALISLLVFVAAAFAAQAWLQYQADLLHADAIAAKRAELARAEAFVAPTAAAWDAKTLPTLETLLGAEIKPARHAPAASAGRLSFYYHPDPQTTLLVTFPTPPSHHLIALYQHALLLLLLLALALFL
ncbi:MAG TPA: hypothetical protein VFB27_04850, partial [Opitutaceae bacterium]|nr:hypothetical protein [Opitutaceae bacterium]